jgi:phage anti-repressor protein
MNELIPISRIDAIAQSGALYPVDFDEAWQWVGYTRKDNALRVLQDNFEAGVEFCSSKKRSKKGSALLWNQTCLNETDTGEFSSKVRKTPKCSKGGRPAEQYYLTTDCFKAFCMMAGTEKGKEVRWYFLDLEKRYKALVEDRRLSKLIRRDFTDVIQDSGLNETMHGFAFKQFTDLINKAVLGMARKYREINNLPREANVREHITPAQAANIAKIERLVGAAIEVGADYCKVKDMITDMGIITVESRVSV